MESIEVEIMNPPFDMDSHHCANQDYQHHFRLYRTKETRGGTYALLWLSTDWINVTLFSNSA